MSGAAEKLPAPSEATLAALLALPDQGRGYEIIDGQLVEKETSAEHGVAQSRLGRVLGPFDRRPGGKQPGGWWFATEVLIDLGPKQVFRPDVAGWRRERMPERPTGTVITVLPDWICEIISPSNASNDTVKKKRAYHKHKVPHYWLLDPVRETLSVLRWSSDGYIEVLSAMRGETVKAEPFDAIEISVGVFFGDDDEEGSPPPAIRSS
ncbi:MAG TPA: Uma2 family endonuclease [Polyangiaceae bacterium]|nr:Uma2 family endonuclease [Polyangiaceae bacterium]